MLTRVPIAAVLIFAAAALADGKPEEPLDCPAGQVRDANSGECKEKPKKKYKPSPRAPERADTEELKKCPPGEKLQRVTCIRAPCPPQCVPVEQPADK